MSQVEIYYFSGTGNSLAVARDLAEKIHGKLIPVTAVIDQERILSDAEMIGMVFPIYDFKPPKIIEKFVRKLEHIGAKYLLAVCTYGITPGKTMKKLAQVITSCGGTLSVGFAVHMPHNGIGSAAFSDAQHAQMFANWKQKCDVIYDQDLRTTPLNPPVNRGKFAEVRMTISSPRLRGDTGGYCVSPATIFTPENKENWKPVI